MSEKEQATDPQVSLQLALQELRHAAGAGALREAEAIGRNISSLLAPFDPGAKVSTVLSRALAALLEGMRGVLSGDPHTALKSLALVQRISNNETLRWAACLWICRGALALGELKRAADAGQQTLELGKDFGAECQAQALAAMADVEAAAGETDSALERLVAAGQFYEAQGDRRGLATVWLAQARIQAAAGQSLDANFAAQRAMQIDPTWGEPTVFLAAEAIKENNLAAAEQYLTGLDRPGGRSAAETSRLRTLVQMARTGAVPHWAIVEYFRLHESRPDDEAIGEALALLRYSPDFSLLREDLAWKLVHLGRYDEAEAQLQALGEQADLSPELQSSLELGLSVVATLQVRHRPPGARAAVAAGKAVPPPRSADAADKAEAVDKAEAGDKVDKGDASPKPILSGALHTLSVPEILEFLRGSGHRSAMIVLHSAHGNGAIQMRSGMITAASSPGCTHIGDLLVSAGAITAEQLRQVAQAQRRDRREPLMGALFVERGVPAAAVRQALTEQLRSAVRELLTWDDGYFAVLPDSGAPDRAPAVTVEVDPQELLLMLG